MMGVSKFASFLGYPLPQLQEIVCDVERYYRHKQVIKKFDDGTPRTLPNGELVFRDINESLYSLKRIQTKIKDLFLNRPVWPAHLHGGIRGRSNITNARAHLATRHHFLTDIKDFFPSICNRSVYNIFYQLGFSPKAARLATMLTTKNGYIPQGAPTSSHLANLVFMETDRKILALLEGHPIVYTRFVDDLTFSSREDFKPLTKEILSIIETDRYSIKRRKRSGNDVEKVTFYKIGSVEITGVVTKYHHLQAPKKLHDKLATLEPGSRKYIGLKNYIACIESK